jgi:hypothetical protein
MGTSTVDTNALPTILTLHIEKMLQLKGRIILLGCDLRGLQLSI